MTDPRLKTRARPVPQLRGLLLSLLLASSLILSTRVIAAPAPGPSERSATGASSGKGDSCLRDERCNALYESAVSLSKAGQFAAALANYEAAYRLQPVPWLLVNIGRIQQKSGNPQGAIENFQRYLALPPSQRDADTAAKAQEYLKQAEEDLRRPKKPMVIREREERGPRPLWRVLTGSGLIALGVTGLGIGMAGLALNGQCVSEPAPGVTCREVYTTIPSGVGFSVAGGLLAVGGAVLVALPGPRKIVRVDSP